MVDWVAMSARVGQQRLRPGISPVDSYLNEVPQDAAIEFFGFAGPAVGGFDVGSRSRGLEYGRAAGDRLFAGLLCEVRGWHRTRGTACASDNSHLARLHRQGGTGSTTGLPKHAVLQRDLRTGVRTIPSAETTHATSKTGSPSHRSHGHGAAAPPSVRPAVLLGRPSGTE